MTIIQVVVKKAGKPAHVCGIDSNLKAMQKIVEGHIRPLWIGNDGTHRIALVVNCDGLDLKLPQNITLEDGTELVGNLFLSKVDSSGTYVSLDENEANNWRDTLNNIKKHEPENKLADTIPDLARPPAEGILQIVVVPRTKNQETGTELTPEEIIEQLALRIGRGCRCLRIDETAELYAEALAVLKQQGHDFELIDGHTTLMQFKNDQRWLRLVQWLPETPITSAKDLARAWGVKISPKWESKLTLTIARQVKGYIIELTESGIEFITEDETAPYPLDYPFTPTDLFSLIKALNNDEPIEIEETIIH